MPSGDRVYKDTSMVQSVLISKKNFTELEAMQWAMDHRFKLYKIDITDDYYRIRQLDPLELNKAGFKKYYTKTIDPINDIKLILVSK